MASKDYAGESNMNYFLDLPDEYLTPDMEAMAERAKQYFIQEIGRDPQLDNLGLSELLVIVVDKINDPNKEGLLLDIVDEVKSMQKRINGFQEPVFLHLLAMRIDRLFTPENKDSLTAIAKFRPSITENAIKLRASQIRRMAIGTVDCFIPILKNFEGVLYYSTQFRGKLKSRIAMMTMAMNTEIKNTSLIQRQSCYADYYALMHHSLKPMLGELYDFNPDDKSWKLNPAFNDLKSPNFFEQTPSLQREQVLRSLRQLHKNIDMLQNYPSPVEGLMRLWVIETFRTKLLLGMPFEQIQDKIKPSLFAMLSTLTLDEQKQQDVYNLVMGQIALIDPVNLKARGFGAEDFSNPGKRFDWNIENLFRLSYPALKRNASYASDIYSRLDYVTADRPEIFIDAPSTHNKMVARIISDSEDELNIEELIAESEDQRQIGGILFQIGISDYYKRYFELNRHHMPSILDSIIDGCAECLCPDNTSALYAGKINKLHSFIAFNTERNLSHIKHRFHFGLERDAGMNHLHKWDLLNTVSAASYYDITMAEYQRYGITPSPAVKRAILSNDLSL